MPIDLIFQVFALSTLPQRRVQACAVFLIFVKELVNILVSNVLLVLYPPLRPPLSQHVFNTDCRGDSIRDFTLFRIFFSNIDGDSVKM